MKGPHSAPSRTDLPDWRGEVGEAPEWLATFPRSAGYLLAAGGALSLAGWAVSVPALDYLASNVLRMFPVNAFCCVCLGLALLLREGTLARLGPARRERCEKALVFTILALNLLRIGEFAFGRRLPIDLRIFPLEGWVEDEMFAAAAAAPPSALNFVLLAIALLIPRQRAFQLFQALPLLVLLVAGLSMGHYLYGGDPLLRMVQMSIPTSGFQIVAAVAVLCLRTESGLMALLRSPTAGGMLLRRLLFPGLVLPPFFGWLRLAGQRAGLYQLEGGVTLFAYTNVILFAALAWWAAAWLNRTDFLREAAESRTRRQLQRLALLEQITRATAQRQDPDSIFEVALGTLEDRLPVDFGGIWLLAEGADRLKLGSLGSSSRQLAPALAGPAAGEAVGGAVGEALGDAAGDEGGGELEGIEACLLGQRIYERDLAASEAPFLRRLAGLGLRSAVLTPLRAERRVFGLLAVARNEPAGFTSGVCEFLTQVADNVAIAAFQAELHRELEGAYLDLRTTQQSALERDRLRALGEMASGIAHDLNNSISPAALHLESVLEKDESLTARTRDRLEVVRRAVLDVAHTVSRMQLAYRQRGAGQMEPIQLNPLALQVLELTRAKWRDTPQEDGSVVEVKTRLAADLPLFRGNESELREALTNLVFNAVDAMPRGGTLELRTFTPEKPRAGGSRRKQVAIEVIDDGIGMDAETRRRCLEPFFTTKGERGSGLGLPRVFGVAERHGGAVEIDSEPGRGTTVRLVFPALAGGLQPAPAAVVPVSARLRVAVIDDDPALLETLQEVFEGDGHDVVAAGGGAAGIEAFVAAEKSGAPFDLVVTDLGMPQVDGRQVAAAIKALAPATPVILLTGWGHRMISERTAAPNFDLILSKPPRLADLRQAVKQLVPRGTPESEDPAAD